MEFSMFFKILAINYFYCDFSSVCCIIIENRFLWNKLLFFIFVDTKFFLFLNFLLSLLFIIGVSFCPFIILGLYVRCSIGQFYTEWSTALESKHMVQYYPSLYNEKSWDSIYYLICFILLNHSFLVLTN